MNPSELFEAIRKKNLTVMKKLLDEGCDPTSYEGDGDHNALSLAAYLKQPEMVEYLIQKGARVNDRTKGGRIALHNAVWRYDKRSVELLLGLVQIFTQLINLTGLPSGLRLIGNRLSLSLNAALKWKVEIKKEKLYSTK